MSVLPELVESAPQGVVLTTEYMKGALARAVPGAEYDSDERAWMLYDPTPRAAVVALKLFPGIEHQHPELLELRAQILQDARPVDWPSKVGHAVVSPRTRRAVEARGWQLYHPDDAQPYYQELDTGYGAEWIKQHGGYIIGWARGKGKTLGTCLIADELDVQSLLVIAPNKAKGPTWAGELVELCPWLSDVLVLPNDKAKRERTLAQARTYHESATPFALVVHYEALAVIAGKDGKSKTGHVKLGDGWKKLGIEWDLIAADEAHRFTNPDSQQSRAARKIPGKARLALTGSLLQNGLEDAYGILHWAYPQQFRSRWRDYNDRWLDFVDNGYGKTCVGILPDKLDDMRDTIGKLVAFREKQSRMKVHKRVVELSTGQRQVYDQLRAEFIAELGDTTIKATSGITMLTKLRQIACGLDLLDAKVQDSAKIDAAVRVIRKNLLLGHDFVVFCWHKATVYAIERRLTELGIESWTLTGDTKEAAANDAVARFQAGERRVFIGTIATMGESLNLQRANHVIRVELSFNPALNQQADDRVDRQGNPRADDLHRTDIIAANTVDELNVIPNLTNKVALTAAIQGDMQ